MPEINIMKFLIKKNEQIIGSLSKEAKKTLLKYLTSDNTIGFLTERLQERLVSFEFAGTQLTLYYPEDLNRTIQTLSQDLY